MDCPINYSHLLALGFQEEVVVLSKDLKVIHANRIFLSRNGLELSNIFQQPCYNFLKGCQHLCREYLGECPLHETLNTGAPSSIVSQDVQVGGKGRHFRIDVYPVPQKDNKFGELFLHVTRDITHRVEERRLRESMWQEILSQIENLYQAMLERNEHIAYLDRRWEHLLSTIPLAIVEWDRQGRVVRWNNGAEILLGWNAQDAVGRSFASFFATGYSQEQIKGVCKKVLKGEFVDYTLGENRTGSGHIVPCEWYHSFLPPDEQGQIMGGLSIGQDLSEMQAQEKELLVLKGQLTAINQSLDLPLFNVNNLARVTSWNLAGERLLGWMEKEILGREIELLFVPEQRGRIRQIIRDIFEYGEEQPTVQDNLEIMAQRKDGSTFPALLTFSLVSKEEGSQGKIHQGRKTPLLRPTQLQEQAVKPVAAGKFGLLVQLKDLTAKKKTEKLLSYSEKMRSLGEMAGGIVHDFNNLLAAMQAGLDLLEADLKTGNRELVQETLDQVRQAVTRGTAKVTSLSNFLQQGQDRGQKTLELYQLKPLVMEVVDLTRFRWKDLQEKAGQTVNLTVDIKDLPPVMLDPEQFKELLTNLLLNAIEALPQGGHIHIEGFQEENKVVLQVQDNGVGMTNEEQEKIFVPYVTAKGEDHAGLGLTRVQKIVRDLGGEIKVESIKGVGTTFSVFLPLLSLTRLDQVTEDGDYDVKLDILLVEDDQLVRELLVRALKMAGHRIAVATTGREGVRTFKRGSFDLVITDFGMPLLNGLDVATRVKKIDPEVPVFMITGWSSDADLPKFKPQVIDELLFKPFDLDRLLRLVRTCQSRV